MARNGLAGAAFLFIDLADDAVIMLRMLQVILCRDAVTGRMSITRQRLILFIDLEGIATDTDVRAAAVIVLMTQRHILTAIATAIATIAAATTTIIAAAAIAAATTTTPLIGSLSHSLYARPLVFRAPGLFPRPVLSVFSLF